MNHVEVSANAASSREGKPADLPTTGVGCAGVRSPFPGYFTDDELLARLAAANYPLKKATLANWRASRRGPPFTKFGRLVLYPEVECRAWLNKKLVGAARRPGRGDAA